MPQSSVSASPVRRHQAQLSKHALHRSQQRGIAPELVPVITTFGEKSHDGRGGMRYLMTDRAMTRLVRVLGRNQQIDRLGGAYVVLSTDGEQVITVAHRHA